MEEELLIKILEKRLTDFELSKDRQSFSYTYTYTPEDLFTRRAPLDVFTISIDDIIRRNKEDYEQFKTNNEDFDREMLNEYLTEHIEYYTSILERLMYALNIEYDNNDDLNSMLNKLQSYMFYTIRHIEKQNFKEIMDKKNIPKELYDEYSKYLFGKKIKHKKTKSIQFKSIKKSTNPKKKYMATFIKNGRKKIIHFGSNGMSDFTKHKDVDRKKRYINRHKKRENWNNPMTAGALSRWILWNKPTLKASIEDYKRRFKL